MPQWMQNWWIGLSTMQRTIVIVVVAVLVLSILASFIFLGTDYSGFGDWVQGWF